MENLQCSLAQSEKTVNFLREQLTILTALAAQKKGTNEEEEIKRISKENDVLRNELVKLKENLQYYEVQNGVVQVEIPKSKTAALKSDIAEPKANEQVCNENEGNAKKGGKGNKEKTGGGKGQPVPPQGAKEVDVSQLNMKIGKIINVKKHPDADTLYVEEVDVGEEKNRTVVSGLVKSYTLDEMQDRMGIFLCNLKPAKMRGVLSEGMIMCASSPEKVETLEIPDGSVIGDRVICTGFPGEPDNQLNPKKKIWEQIQKDLHVRKDGVASYKGDAFTVVGKGVCVAPTMRECIIK